MKVMFFRYFLIVTLLGCPFTFHPMDVQAELSRPSTITGSRTSTLSKPGQGKNPVQSPQLQRQLPGSKLQSGYCLVNGEIERLDQKTCQKKRGKFFTDQRSAQKAADALQGYCCKDGNVKRTTQGICKRTKGAFFLRQNDAAKTCAATRGFCCDKGEVAADSKGSCDRKKGRFAVQKKDADTICAKQKGYCCKDGKVTQSSQGKCTKSRGVFAIRQADAQRTCERQNGYCCENGKVSRMNQGSCLKKKGKFFMRQIQAQQTCDKESGFCCSGGKITQTSRGACQKQKGQFSLNRATLSRTCAPVKAPAAASKVVVGKAALKPVSKPVIPEKAFDEPIFKQKTASSTAKMTRSGKAPSAFDSPVFVPPASKKSIADRSVQQNSKKGKQSKQLSKMVPAAGVGLVTAGGLSAAKSTRDSTAPPISLLQFNPSSLEVVVNEENFQMPDGKASNKLVLKSMTVRVTCGAATLQAASLTVGNNYFTVDEIEKIVDESGKMVFYDWVIATHAEFTKDYATTNDVSQIEFPFILEKTCVTDAGVQAHRDNFELTIRYTSDSASLGGRGPAGSYGQGQVVAPPILSTEDLAEQALSMGFDQNVEAPNPNGVVGDLKAPSNTIAIHSVKSRSQLTYWYVGGSSKNDFVHAPGGKNPQLSPGITTDLEGTIQCGLGNVEEADMYVLGGNKISNVQDYLNAEGQFSMQGVALIEFTEIPQAFNCSEGQAYFDRQTDLQLVVDYSCSSSEGNSRRYESDPITIPVKLTCDRRELGSLPERVIQRYKHECPAGYVVENYGTQSVLHSQGWNDPLSCVKP